MKSNVIYFPYMQVPDSAWFTRILLYWDQVSTIIPYEYIEDPERLGEHTRSLIEHELIHQVFPHDYTYNVPSFHSSFGAYVGSLDSLESRRKAFRTGQTVPIHMEKLGSVVDMLVDTELARQQDRHTRWSWYDVEEETANDFMTYLAGYLGELEDISAHPITDQEENLSPFDRRSSDERQRNRDALRQVVLAGLFPAPERPLGAKEIAIFKERHGHALRSFRRHVEREVINLLQINDKELREERLELFRDEIRDSVDAVRASLAEGGVGRISLSEIAAVGLEVAGAPSGLSLIPAIGRALRDQPRTQGELPLAFAAHAQIDLLEAE